MATWEELAGGRTPETCRTLARFIRYEDANPELLPVLEGVIGDELQKRAVWSVYPAIDAVIRWQSNQPLYDPEKRFRIPNDFKPWYLRRVLANHPEWAGRLEMRTLFCCGGATQEAPEEDRKPACMVHGDDYRDYCNLCRGEPLT